MKAVGYFNPGPITASEALVDAGTLRSTLNSQSSPINAANLKIFHETAEQGTAIGKNVLVGF